MPGRCVRSSPWQQLRSVANRARKKIYFCLRPCVCHIHRQTSNITPCIYRIHQVWSTGINVCAATSCTIQVLPSRRRRAVCRAVLTQTRNVEVHSELMHFLLNAKARPHRSRRHHHRLHRHRARQTSAQITTESIASQEPPWISVSRW